MDAFAPAELTRYALAVWFLTKGLAQLSELVGFAKWKGLGLSKWLLAGLVAYLASSQPSAEAIITAAALAGAAGIIKPLAELAKGKVSA